MMANENEVTPDPLKIFSSKTRARSEFSHSEEKSFVLLFLLPPLPNFRSMLHCSNTDVAHYNIWPGPPRKKRTTVPPEISIIPAVETC